MRLSRVFEVRALSRGACDLCCLWRWNRSTMADSPITGGVMLEVCPLYTPPRPRPHPRLPSPSLPLVSFTALLFFYSSTFVWCVCGWHFVCAPPVLCVGVGDGGVDAAPELRAVHSARGSVLVPRLAPRGVCAREGVHTHASTCVNFTQVCFGGKRHGTPRCTLVHTHSHTRTCEDGVREQR